MSRSQAKEQFYAHLSTATLAASATAVLVSSTNRLAGTNRTEVPEKLVLDAIYGSGLGTAGVIVLSASGTVIERIGFAANESFQFNPIEIYVHDVNGVTNARDDLSIQASGSVGFVRVEFHRE